MIVYRRASVYLILRAFPSVASASPRNYATNLTALRRTITTLSSPRRRVVHNYPIAYGARCDAGLSRSHREYFPSERIADDATRRS